MDYLLVALQLGPLLIFYGIHQYVKSRDEKKMFEQIRLLYKWHDKDDDDGVKVWYNRRGLEDAIEKMAEAIEHLSNNVAQQTLVTQITLDMLKDTSKGK